MCFAVPQCLKYTCSQRVKLIPRRHSKILSVVPLAVLSKILRCRYICWCQISSVPNTEVMDVSWCCTWEGKCRPSRIKFNSWTVKDFCFVFFLWLSLSESPQNFQLSSNFLLKIRNQIRHSFSIHSIMEVFTILSCSNIDTQNYSIQPDEVCYSMFQSILLKLEYFTSAKETTKTRFPHTSSCQSRIQSRRCANTYWTRDAIRKLEV